MIRIARVIGEVFDFDSGEEQPKSVVLTDGENEMVLPVSDEQLTEILTFWSFCNEEKSSVVHKETFEKELETKMPGIEDQPDVPAATIEEDAKEPGEQYAEATTGVASI